MIFIKKNKATNKFAQQITMNIIEKQINQSIYSEEKKEELKNMIKVSLQKDCEGLKEPKDIILERFRNSFYCKNNREYTSAMEEVENSEYENLLRQVVFEKMCNQELKVIYDDCLIDDSAIYIAFKIKDRLAFVYLFQNDNSKKFDVDNAIFYFVYPKVKQMSLEDKNLFMKAINEYNDYNEIFNIEKNAVNINNNPKPNKKKNNRLIFWGYFWRYGIIALAFLLPTILSIIMSNIESLNKYAKYVIAPSIGLPLCAMGIDYILACIFKFPHILLVNQSASHQKMDPDDLDWNSISIKEFIGIGAICLILGIFFMIITIMQWI